MVQDELLYRKIKQGDLAAFDVLYERYRLRLYRFIYSYLKNTQEAEEIFQEAFMKILNSNDLDFSEGTFQAWIFEVARNLSLNGIRARGRANLAMETLPTPQPQASVETELSRHATTHRVQEAFARLPEAQHEVLNLKLLGVTEKEIAKTLQIPIGTVKSRFNSLIQFIKQEVQE